MHSSYPRPNKPKGLLEFCAKNTEKRLSFLTLKEYRWHIDSCCLTDLPVVFSGTLKEEDISLGFFDRGIETRPHFLPFDPNQVLSRTLFHYALFCTEPKASHRHLCGVFQQSAMTKIMFVCAKKQEVQMCIASWAKRWPPPFMQATLLLAIAWCCQNWLRLKEGKEVAAWTVFSGPSFTPFSQKRKRKEWKKASLSPLI